MRHAKAARSPSFRRCPVAEFARFALAAARIDADALRTRLAHQRAGAFACFEGWVRNHNDGRAVVGLHYEAHSALAEAEGARILEEALRRFDVLDACCVHRTGELATGDMAVWTGVVAEHRAAAFDACRWIIDTVKERVPIWKHERYAQGDAQWLHPDPV
jgi:molybdopterin synthase catalytic subunit